MAPLISRTRTRTQAVLLFVVLSALILTLGLDYQESRVANLKNQRFDELARIMGKEVETLIAEKNNATLAIALALKHDNRLAQQLAQGETDRSKLESLSLDFRERTDFKNVWIQLLDRGGRVLARSWTEQQGDELSPRTDVRSLQQQPQPQSWIGVDRYDLAFRAMAPIQDGAGQWVGMVEVLTHFNSIARKIEELGYDPLILVHPQHKSQIDRPFTGIFFGDHYVANLNPRQDLRQLVLDKGLSGLTHPRNAYLLNADSGLLVINHSLFDKAQQPLANILMLRPASEIELEGVELLTTRVNLLLFLSLLGLAFLLYVYSERMSPDQSKGPLAKKLLFGTLFLFLSLTYAAILYQMTKERQAEYLEVRNTSIQRHYDFILGKYQDVAESIFYTSIDQPEIMALMATAHQGPEAKEQARRQLHERLNWLYDYLFGKNLRQLHFHLNNNESFLRFHRPGKFGDDLSQVRATVAWTNRQQVGVSGFEEGRIYNGFRNLFPLFYRSFEGKREHVGSVEISFNAHAFARELIVQANDRAGFLIKDEVVDDKVFAEEQANYSPSPVAGFYYQNEIRAQLQHANLHMDLSLLRPAQLQGLEVEILKGRTLTLISPEQKHLFTFIPIRNPISKSVVATLVLQTEDLFLAERADNMRLLLALGLIASLIISLFAYRVFADKEQIHALLRKTQSILDAQDAIVIITNGERLIDCNQKLLKFLGLADIAAFRQQHRCICERFLADDKFFHLGKVPEGENWVQCLLRLPKRDHIVSMRDHKGRPHAFAVSLSTYEQDHIVAFSDISDTMREHFDLAQRVIHDKLTGAYNREFFSTHAPDWIDQCEREQVILGLVVFDIDHFKQINDTYGHARGDLVLVNLVKVVERTIRQGDALIRWGGEEFLILAKTDRVDHLVRMAENLREQIQAEVYEEVQQVTCSFGITLFRGNEALDKALDRADHALYQAKRNGRNRVEVEL